MAGVQLRGVNKIYGTGPSAVHAVRDLDLDIDDGEFVALLGPSGCGKTSTLRMIVGLEVISSGEIAFDGERVNEREPGERNVAMAFETYALYPNFSVAENLAFPLEVRGLDGQTRRREVQRVAEMLRITDILELKPGQLSGGQQQRVGLGRALIRDPAVFILDEVLSHIDAHLKFQMLFELKQIHRELGRTMIYVTHDQVEALALADRVAVMSDALLQQVGTRDDLYHRPANRFVADFIGEPPTNFFEVTLVERDGRALFAAKGSDLELSVSEAGIAAARASGGSDFTVGLRPQNLRLGAAPSGSGRSFAELAGELLVDEFLGEQSILTLRSGADEYRALAAPDHPAADGEQAALHYAVDDVLVFDAGNGQRLALD